MDASILAELTATLGFPMVIAFCSIWFLYQMVQQNREDTSKREERMYKQLDKFGESMDRFNDTLIAIDKRLEVVEDKIDKN